VGERAPVAAVRVTERHARASHLAMDPIQIDGRSFGRLIPIKLTKQSLFDFALRQVFGLLPIETHPLGTGQVIADRRLAQSDRYGDLALDRCRRARYG
jgi:hypothetical protein